MNRVSSSYQIADITHFPATKKCFKRHKKWKKKNITKKYYLCVYIYWWGRMHVLSRTDIYDKPHQNRAQSHGQKIQNMWHFFFGTLLAKFRFFGGCMRVRKLENVLNLRFLFSKKGVYNSIRGDHKEVTQWLGQPTVFGGEPHKSFDSFGIQTTVCHRLIKTYAASVKNHLRRKTFGLWILGTAKHLLLSYFDSKIVQLGNGA